MFRATPVAQDQRRDPEGGQGAGDDSPNEENAVDTMTMMQQLGVVPDGPPT